MHWVRRTPDNRAEYKTSGGPGWGGVVTVSIESKKA